MKKYLAIFISILPTNLLRISLYNTLFGYKISFSSKIGFGTIINIKKAIIKKARIGKFNYFSGPFNLKIKEGSDIGSFNTFKSIRGKNALAFCEIGSHTHVTDHHLIDASGGFILKDFSRIAGTGSQFWTHGGQRPGTEITINEKCYVGSGAIFSQGVSIAENTFVGLGSVVVDSFDEPGILLFGNPAQPVKKGIIARKSLVR